MAYITCINIMQGAGSYQGNIHMQVQLNVCSDVKYGDFVVWTEGEMAMERITIDREFYKSAAEQNPCLLMVHCQKLSASGTLGKM